MFVCSFISFEDEALIKVEKISLEEISQRIEVITGEIKTLEDQKHEACSPYINDLKPLQEQKAMLDAQIKEIEEKKAPLWRTIKFLNAEKNKKSGDFEDKIHPLKEEKKMLQEHKKAEKDAEKAQKEAKAKAKPKAETKAEKEAKA